MLDDLLFLEEDDLRPPRDFRFPIFFFVQNVEIR